MVLGLIGTMFNVPFSRSISLSSPRTPYNNKSHLSRPPVSQSINPFFSKNALRQYIQSFILRPCHQAEFLVADVLLDVVKTIGRRSSDVLELTSYLANAYKVTRSDLGVSILCSIRPSPWNFVRFFVPIPSHYMQWQVNIFHLFIPLNCEFL